MKISRSLVFVGACWIASGWGAGCSSGDLKTGADAGSSAEGGDGPSAGRSSGSAGRSNSGTGGDNGDAGAPTDTAGEGGTADPGGGGDGVGGSSAGVGTGGRLSTGGTAGRGGGANAGRGGLGTGGGTPSTGLGDSCPDAVCDTGLDCFAGPVLPAGLCSIDCMTTADCGADVCNTDNGICIESCVIGAEGAAKCHARLDMACTPVGLIATTRTCTMDANCNPTEVCADTGGASPVCVQVTSGCLPTCGSDDDCDGGFCNLGLGVCDPVAPTGLEIGSLCDPAATTDPCAGFCLQTPDGLGVCSGVCRLGGDTDPPGCGAEASSDVVDADCLLIPDLEPAADVGDNAFCIQLCDCTADCLRSDFGCVELPRFGRAGICVPVAATDPVITVCP